MTSQGRTLAEVWVACIKEHLREFLYMAQMASLELEIVVKHDAIELQFSGFNDSLPPFVTQALTWINGFASSKDLEGIFGQVKEKLLQEWHNFYFE